MQTDGKLNCVLFDHIMLESKDKAKIHNYDELIKLLDSADIKEEIPNDMFEWIWIHMAINAGVCTTKARSVVLSFCCFTGIWKEYLMLFQK